MYVLRVSVGTLFFVLLVSLQLKNVGAATAGILEPSKSIRTTKALIEKINQPNHALLYQCLA